MEFNYVTDVGKIIDMPPKEFVEFCADKDMGYIRGLENLVLFTYNHLCKMKDKLVRDIVDEGKQEEYTMLLKATYAKMMDAERVVFTLRAIQKEREIPVDKAE